MLTKEEKLARLESRRAAKKQIIEAARIEAEKSQLPVKELTITIEWRKSRMWGSNPHAEVSVSFHDHTYTHAGPFSCSGCGYDKESTVIAEVFNKFMKYKLWALGISGEFKNNGGNISDVSRNKVPYGIVCYNNNSPHYSGGIGTNCYTAISEFIGGKFERIASGKTFDVYKYTDGKEDKNGKC